MDRLEEGIRVVRALWQGGPVDWEGQHYALRGATLSPRPWQEPSPPILVGGDGERRLLRIAAEHADEWNSHAGTPEIYRAKRSRLEDHCRSVGRDLDQIKRSWMGGLCIGRGPREVAERASGLAAGFSPLPCSGAAGSRPLTAARARMAGRPARGDLPAASGVGGSWGAAGHAAVLGSGRYGGAGPAGRGRARGARVSLIPGGVHGIISRFLIGSGRSVGMVDEGASKASG